MQEAIKLQSHPVAVLKSHETVPFILRRAYGAVP